MARILSVSYDLGLLSSRQLLLESFGHEVFSVSDFAAALQHCRSGAKFDAFVLGHSIPGRDKEALISAFRSHCSAPVVALRKVGEESAPHVDYCIDPEPAQLLAVISGIISGHAASA